MREIKFRAQVEGENTFVYGNVFKNNTCTRIIPEQAIIDDQNRIDERYIVDPETVGQFTGKKDSKGNEIYEGDIIEFDRREWGGNGNIHVVEWDDHNAEWYWGGGSTSDMEWRTVIGNIYENPELLK